MADRPVADLRHRLRSRLCPCRQHRRGLLRPQTEPGRPGPEAEAEAEPGIRRGHLRPQAEVEAEAEAETHYDLAEVEVAVTDAEYRAIHPRRMSAPRLQLQLLILRLPQMIYLPHALLSMPISNACNDHHLC